MKPVLKRKSLAELYDEAGREETPRERFIRTLAESTGRSERTVKSWVYGTVIPTGALQRLIARILQVNPVGLFSGNILATCYANAVNQETPKQKFIRELAEKTGKTTATVKQWVYGVQVPNKATIDLIASIYDIDPAGLFPKENDDQSNSEDDGK